MKILIFFFLLFLYLTSGQLLGLNVVPVPKLPVPIVDTVLKTSDGTLAPGVRYATSIQELNNLGLNASAYDDSTLEDSFLKAPKLIRKYGYPCEIHTVVTEDQYILEMHRIPGSPHAKNNGQRKQPIFLMHGLLDSSSTWVIMRPNQGLGYLLADLGYDVWLGNTRGNRYSRKHVTLNPDGEERYKYWDFSWHEIGTRDLPTMIDCVLATTGFQKLHYIGHSQGGTVGYVLTSELPEYNDKLISMQLMAPASFMSRNKGVFVQLAALLQGPLKLVIKDLLGMYEFLPSHDLLTLLARLICTESMLLVPLACTNLLYLISGFNPEQTDVKMLPIIAGHIPVGVATNNVFHFLQLVTNGRFCQYDYGPEKNLITYGQSTPPEYNLNNIQTPVALYYSDNDMLVGAEDIKKMATLLPNLIEIHRVTDSKFSHTDFTWAIDVKELVYNRLFTNLQVAEQMQLAIN